MHELSITSDILDLVLCELAKAITSNKNRHYHRRFIGDCREHIKYYFELLGRATCCRCNLTINYKKVNFDVKVVNHLKVVIFIPMSRM